MRIAKIMKNDIANGEGVCVSLWTQGCPHRCPGCHNPETWDFSGGVEKDEEQIISEIKKAIKANGLIRNFSILGGEPLSPGDNLRLTDSVIRAVRLAYPDIKITMWTGYTIEELSAEQLNAISEVDTLIDGRFMIDLKDLTLELRGSSNQRVLGREDIKAEIDRRAGKLPTTKLQGAILLDKK